MNIEIGEYVRTKDGIIAKCVQESHNKYIFDKVVIEEGYYSNYIFKDIPERDNFIVKHSENVLDLVEHGDIINYEYEIEPGYCVNLKTSVDIDAFRQRDYKNIISILTHEQYEASCYRLEE